VASTRTNLTVAFVAALVADIAADLTGQPAEEAVLALERRLDEAERTHQDREKKNEGVNSLIKEIGELGNERLKIFEVGKVYEW